MDMNKKPLTKLEELDKMLGFFEEDFILFESCIQDNRDSKAKYKGFVLRMEMIRNSLKEPQRF